MVHEFKPHLRLCADSSEPGTCFRLCVCLSLSAPPLHALSLSQKQINFLKKMMNHLTLDLRVPGIEPHIGLCTTAQRLLAILSLQNGMGHLGGSVS